MPQRDGYPLLFLPIPNKESVYEECLPRRIRKHRGVNTYTKIIRHLAWSGKFTDFIDTHSILLQLKQDQQVYLKTDSHWNNNGAYGVYRALINRLSDKRAHLRPVQQKPEGEWRENFSGDLAV